MAPEGISGSAATSQDRRSLGLAFGALAFVLLLWMNQSIPLAEWKKLQAEVFVTHSASTFETARYPLTFMYRRAADEELYFELTGAMLGREINRPLLVKAREGCGDAFQKPLPPSDGRWHAPYAEVPVEYPPLVLPFVLVPRMFTDSLRHYCWILGALMGACLLGAVAVLARAFMRTGEDARGTSRRVLLVTAVFLAHGAIAIQRLDAVTTLLLALAVAAWMSRSLDRLAFWIGLAAASKFLPILLVLPIVAADPELLPAAFRGATAGERRAGLVATARLFGVAGLTFALGLFPFFVFSPTALFEVLQYHGARGLHGESVLGSLWALFAIGAPAVHTYGSYNLAGPVPDFLGRIAMPLTLASLAAFAWFTFRRAGTGPLRAGLVMLTALVLLWTTGKVFSPQYLTWGVPLLLLVPRAALRNVALLYAALAGVSQLYFRGYFDAVYNLEPLGVWTLFLRDIVLGALVAVLLKVCLGREASPTLSRAKQTA